MGAVDALAVLSKTEGIIPYSNNENWFPLVIGTSINTIIKLHNTYPPTLIKTIRMSER